MRPELLDVLRCPETGLRLRVEAVECEDGDVVSGYLVPESGGVRYPIIRSIPRFAPSENYASSFGLQWKRFSQTQLDSHSGLTVSADRFWKATGWKRGDLQGAWVLDVGCGAGRFAEIALTAGATVVAVDYSEAVDVCLANLRHFSTLHVVQADIYRLPFARGAFRFVYSLGVLQHTPDVDKAFAALPPLVAAGGRLCVDVYERSWRNLVHPKYWLRPFAKRLDKTRLLLHLETVGSFAPYTEPCLASCSCGWPLWLSAEFDQPRRAKDLERWFGAAGFEQVEVLRAGHLVGRGVKRP